MTGGKNIVQLGTYTTKNGNTFLAYYSTTEKEPKPSISYNGHCIYIKGITTKDCAYDTLRDKFKAGKEELKWFKELNFNKFKIKK